MMKTSILLGITALSLKALASQNIIYKSSRHRDPRISHHYKVAEQSDRAWLVIDFKEPETHPQDPRDWTSIRPPGMTLDQNKKTIQYKESLCATYQIKGRGLFRRTIIRPTGDCRLKKFYTWEEFDSGTDIFDIRYLNLSLETRD